ncbi:precorrin-3B C(17)-methyltransferase [Rubrobacter taiwanensis]|uniref:Precorrin-3B C(17)-methyltransferase n=1 Tax=Rubrobacter taiwanensis TaxID=185139 RepID=A0A4R1B9N1_9ACTN|nr:precorrin-3B C(17)-methyltransferase [Rubrobacter taiwanensis]TCJ13630.1 precorrin-3B C(17)-methyltransferase [Rubrobacter taiwanensis]
MLGLVAATANGRRLASHLAAAWEDARLYEGGPKEALPRAWEECGGIVLFLAAGAAVRLLAPLLRDKRTDPGVVCVDDAGRFAVPLAGGHGGGANALARRVAATLGAEPVITTASDALNLPGLDALGRELGFRLEEDSDLAAVGAALLSGERVNLVCDRRWPLGPLPENVAPSGELEPPLILISDRTVPVPRPAAVYRPPTLLAGVGSSRGAGAEEILKLLERSLAEAGLSPRSLAALATVDLKAGEEGLLRAAEALEVPLRFYPAEELAGLEVPNPSEEVRRAVGTPSVAEAAVLASGARLVLQKRKSQNATVALGRLPVRGRLYLIGLGPGDESLIPPLARNALARAEVVVGLEQYVRRVRHLLRPGTRVLTPPLGQELQRAELALAEARAGGSAALVSGGDAGVYGMASPALERERGEVEVTVVPGITAAQAAAALLGSPLGHDHCSISLSDLLTPWETIRERILCAARGDFVISLYNPRSKGRDRQLAEVRRLLLAHRDPETPVGIVTDAYRPEERVTLTDLASLPVEEVGMRSIVIVGSSRTRVVAGRMVTPRGYEG